MTDSVFTGSVVVADDVASGRIELVGFPELPGVADASGEGEHALTDAGLTLLRGCQRSPCSLSDQHRANLALDRYCPGRRS